MTISTIIPYRAGKQYAPADGPTNCTRCARSLLDRSSDRVEDSWDARTNAELTVHIWEHDVDDEMRALCGSCAEEDAQTEAWRQLVTWMQRSDRRGCLMSNAGVELFEGGRSLVMFAGKSGHIGVGAVLAFVGKDPLRPGASSPPPRFDLLAGDMHEATMEMGANLRAYSDADELQPARDFAWADEECPKTERNTEHEG